MAGLTYIGSSYRATTWNSPITTNSNLGTWIGVGTYDTIAYGINSLGQVVGTSAVAGNLQATLWNGDLATNLDTTGSAISQANAINDSGLAVGNSTTIHKASSNYSEYQTTHAMLWDGTASTDLGTLGGSYSNATAINNAGQVVGIAATARDATGLATLWSGATVTSLGTLVGGEYSQANAINNAGLVVGYSSFGSISNAHATLWDGTKVIDLNSFLNASTLSAGWVLNQATGINDNGWIVGNASNSLLGITTDAFLLSTAIVSAVPIPAAVWLFTSGLGLMAFTRRKNKIS